MASDPMEAIREFIEAFNGQDISRAQGACADDVAIVDDFPPFLWTGSSATETWMTDMDRMAEEYGMSDWSVTLNEPRQAVDLAGRAYYVLPVDVRWLEHGVPTERAGFLTLGLQKSAEGWRISAFTWTWQ